MSGGVNLTHGHIDRITHFDRIKKMNPYELSEFICSIYDDNADKNIEGYTILDYDEDRIKQWLETEVEE